MSALVVSREQAVESLKAAAGQAITAISFELERAFERRDEAACLQLNDAKNALIAALEMFK